MNVFEEIKQKCLKRKIGRSSFMEFLKVLDEVEKEYNNGWIPCKDRLPEESLQSVIGWDEYRERCVFVQYLQGRWVLGNDVDSVKITAWRTLPPDYKESEEE